MDKYRVTQRASSADAGHHPDDPQRPMPFDKGHPMAYAPTVYLSPRPAFAVPPLAPIPHHTLYEPSSHAPPTPTASSMYSPFEISMSTGQSNYSKRKAHRVFQAYDSCGRLIAKCDETKPCKDSRKKNVHCDYGRIPKHNLQDLIRDKLTGELESIGSRMENNAEDDRFDEQPGPPLKPTNSKISEQRTTHAGLLLTWPCIQSLVQQHLDAASIRFPSEYPIRQEQQRGIIRVFGSGEGSDQRVMTDVRDNYSDNESSAPPGEVRGQIGGLSPAFNVSVKGGVIDMDGSPDYRWETITHYVQSFKDNILTLHPIIIPDELDAMVKLFYDALSPFVAKQSQGASFYTKFASQPSSANPTSPEGTAAGTKRKRQGSSRGNDTPGGSFMFPKTGQPYRTIHSALILVVLALGKICLHRGSIPDVVHETISQPHSGSSLYRDGIQWQSSGMPSPEDTTNNNHISRTQQLKNYHVIPGLEYFALATEIMGSHIGGYNLKHVYVFIFAGLYHGQLGRILESWSYINKASQTLYVTMRPSLSRLSKVTPAAEAKRDNQLLFAFWTCLELESDILAELPLTASPLLNYEESLKYPSLAFGETLYSESVMQSYFAQLHLRKRLNDINNAMYTPKDQYARCIDDPDFEDDIFNMQLQLRDARSQWVPPHFKWNDTDPPASDLLSARIRAKYWGSQVIIYRPFIKSIVDKEGAPKFKYTLPDHSRWAEMYGGLTPEMVPAGLDVRTLHYARQGVRALVESTRAFHGLPRDQRIIITNHFGTAHAQWGNLITLSAVYKNDILKQFVGTEELTGLFTRTIEMFEFVATRGSSLKSDMNILIGLGADLGLI